MKPSGIPGVGDLGSGAHLCYFHSSPRDLLDVVIRYVKAGLEGNEYCLWVTAPPYSISDASAALEAVLPKTRDFMHRRQLEIVDQTEWYLSEGAFDIDAVVERWTVRADRAKRSGFTGMRSTGHPAWLTTIDDWTVFDEYERRIQEAIQQEQVIALCTYASAACTPEQMLQVMINHGHALFRLSPREWTTSTLTMGFQGA